MISKSIKNIHNLQQIGYTVLKSVISAEKCKNAILQSQRMKQVSGFNKRNFSNNKPNFIIDNNKVSYFFQNAYQNDPNLNIQSLIKIGHSLHMRQIFKEITYSNAVKQLQNQLNIDCLVVQSMILQKKPMKGGTLGLHQDSTYLITQPQSILAWWMPLQDVTKQNGCVWVLPGTHLGKLYTRFKILEGKPTYEFDGHMDYDQKDCIPIEMQKGDILVFNGRLLHKSHDNLSKNSRFAYTWHTMNRNSKWLQENWMTYQEIIKNQPIVQ